MLSMRIGDRSIELSPDHHGQFIAREDGTPIPLGAWRELVESDPDLEWDTTLVLQLRDGSEVPRARWTQHRAKPMFQYAAGRIRVSHQVIEGDDTRPIQVKASSLAKALGALLIYDETWHYDGAEIVLPIHTELWPGAPRRVRGAPFRIAFELSSDVFGDQEEAFRQLEQLDEAEIPAFAAALLTLAGPVGPEYVKEYEPNVFEGLRFASTYLADEFAALAESDDVERFSEAELARHAIASQKYPNEK